MIHGVNVHVVLVHFHVRSNAPQNMFLCFFFSKNKQQVVLTFLCRKYQNGLLENYFSRHKRRTLLYKMTLIAAHVLLSWIISGVYLLTLQSRLVVCIQPLLSVLIQQPVLDSSSLSRSRACTRSLSFLIHGANFAPRCINAS